MEIDCRSHQTQRLFFSINIKEIVNGSDWHITAVWRELALYLFH
jgi:hypothetical protein